MAVISSTSCGNQASMTPPAPRRPLQLAALLLLAATFPALEPHATAAPGPLPRQTPEPSAAKVTTPTARITPPTLDLLMYHEQKVKEFDAKTWVEPVPNYTLRNCDIDPASTKLRRLPGATEQRAGGSGWFEHDQLRSGYEAPQVNQVRLRITVYDPSHKAQKGRFVLRHSGMAAALGTLGKPPVLPTGPSRLPSTGGRDTPTAASPPPPPSPSPSRLPAAKAPKRLPGRSTTLPANARVLTPDSTLVGTWDIKPKWTQVGPRSYQADVVVNTGYLPGPKAGSPAIAGPAPTLRGTVELVSGKKVVDTMSVSLTSPHHDLCVSHEAIHQAKLEAKAKADAKAKAELEAKTAANLGKAPFVVRVVGYEPPIELTSVPGCAGGSRFAHETRHCGAVSHYKGAGKGFLDHLDDAIDTLNEGFSFLKGKVVDVFVLSVKAAGYLTGACSVIDTVAGAGQCESTLGVVAETAGAIAIDVALAAHGIPPSVPDLDQLIHQGAGYLASYAVEQAAAQTGVPLPDVVAEELAAALQDQLKKGAHDVARIAGLRASATTMGTMWYREPICEDIYGIDWGSEPKITVYVEVERRDAFVGDRTNWTLSVSANGFQHQRVSIPEIWPKGSDTMVIPVVLRADYDLVASSVTSIFGSDWRAEWMKYYWKSGTYDNSIRATAHDSDLMSYRSEACTDTAGIGCANVHETKSFTSGQHWGMGKAPQLLPDCNIGQLTDDEKAPMGL